MLVRVSAIIYRQTYLTFLIAIWYGGCGGVGESGDGCGTWCTGGDGIAGGNGGVFVIDLVTVVVLVCYW